MRPSTHSATAPPDQRPLPLRQRTHLFGARRQNRGIDPVELGAGCWVNFDNENLEIGW